MADRGEAGHHAGMRRRYAGKQRAELVELVRSEEVTVTEAAARLGVTRSTAYYWVRDRGPTGGRGPARQAGAVRAPVASQPTFVRVVPSGRGLLHTSTVAHLIVSKFGLGVPHYRLERDVADQGVEGEGSESK